MEIQRTTRGFTVTQPECFSLYDSVLCGQFFRYTPLENGLRILSGDKACDAFTVTDGYELITRDPDYFIRFFDLAFDYAGAVRQLSAFPELTAPIALGRGIRIFNQPLVETVISFIISANNNIPRIKGIIERLCQKAGREMDGYYAFPTLDELLGLDERDYSALGAGFRSRYLAEAVRALADGALEDIRQKKAGALLSLKGVGQKVADCVTLFGLHDFTGYPVDTWVFKANRSDELSTPLKVREYYTQRYGGLAGLAQQYVFYFSRKQRLQG